MSFALFSSRQYEIRFELLFAYGNDNLNTSAVWLYSSVFVDMFVFVPELNCAVVVILKSAGGSGITGVSA